MKAVPLLDLKRQFQYMEAELMEALRRCLDHQRWILGPEVEEFEEAARSYLRVSNAIGVASGTDALVVALRALAIKIKGREYFDPADEIITTPFTFTATGDAILRAGATPVFVDIDPLSFNLNPERMGEYLENHAERVVGILPVHLYGNPCQMDQIMELAEAYGLFVVEDVAQAFGGEWEGRKLGTIGTVGAFSFFPTKNLGGWGDGGLVVTDDEELAEIIRMLGRHGGRDKYNAEHIGYNSRLDTFQAAILKVKLKHVDEFNKRRRQIAALYEKGFSTFESVELPHFQGGHVFHQYTIRIKKGNRDKAREHLKQRAVATAVYYPLCLHQMSLFLGRCRMAGSLREAERATKEVLSLPMDPLLEEKEVAYVVSTLREVLT